MENVKNVIPEEIRDQEQSSLNYQDIIRIAILYWKWFLLSVIICVGIAAIYLRYATTVYQATTKMLIKNDDNNSRYRSANRIAQAANLGFVEASDGFDNEMEILSSRLLAEQAARDLKLYVTYYRKGRIKEHIAYHNNPINVDMDPTHLELLKNPIILKITHDKEKYHITGTYFKPLMEGGKDLEYQIDKSFNSLPATINTKVGLISFSHNACPQLTDGETMKVVIVSPRMISYKYLKALKVSPTAKTTTIAQITLDDEVPLRATDYLRQLAIVYNRQANEDKNEVARRTEEFINERIEKLNAELGNTEGTLEDYKKRNQLIDIKLNSSQTIANASQYQQKLSDAQMQVELINSLRETMNASKDYAVLPANVGITDASVTTLISKYNEISLNRSRLLNSASESSPAIIPLTNQLDELRQSISVAMNQAKLNAEIQLNKIERELNRNSGRMTETPEQERILTQIGRQQEVKSALYVMLLQKREENSISLASTVDKGKLIDTPELIGKIKPKGTIILLVALILGIGIPAALLFLIQLLRYKIEGHEDVEKLTKLPIIADVAIASESSKTKADIVVHENQNNTMEEIFRSMRTNLQFTMKEGEKVVLFTSTTSGEGKTFNCANLSISFALLGKKVLLIGLDIRKPRLAELFEINDNVHGITNLLIKEEPTWEDINRQILPSGINNNLELLMAGPIPPNPAELVARKSLDKIINELKQHYDYILIDTAPVGLVTDTQQIGRIADATVYMCRADYTAKESFNLINELSETKKLPKMSIVLNGVDMSKKKYGYYYGYGKYGKYGKYGRYGRYGNSSYGSYGNYSKSHYGSNTDDSVKH